MSRTIGIALLAALVIALVFLPAMGGGYQLDDGVNLTRNENVQLSFADRDFLSRALNSGIASDIGRPISMLSFALEYALVGEFDPQVSKGVNLAIHLLNFTLLLALVRTAVVLFRQWGDLSERGAAQLLKWAPIIAFAWAVLPTNISSVVYVVQRMNLLAATFSLLALWLYFFQRIRPQMKVWARAALVAAALGSICFGILAKENAVLTLVFILGFELIILYRGHIGQWRSGATGLLLAVLVILIPMAHWLGGSVLAPLYDLRPFDWQTRLLYQPLAILWYLKSAFLPLVQTPRFYMDFLEIQAQGAPPAAVWLALGSVLVALVCTLWGLVRNASLVLYFSLGWFFVFHLVESTIWPLELGFLHRNYLPSAGLVLGLAWFIYRLRNRFPARASTISLGVSLYLMATLGGALLESMRWSDDYTLLASEAEQDLPSTRASFHLGQWYLDNDSGVTFCQEMSEQFQRTRELSPNKLSGYYGTVMASERCDVELTDQLFTEIEDLLVNEPPVASSLLFLDILADRCRNMESFTCARLEHLVRRALTNPAIGNRNYAIEYRMILAKVLFYQEKYAASIDVAQEVLARDNDHFSAHLLMMDIMYVSRNCAGIGSAARVLSQSSAGYEISVGALSLFERYPECDPAQLE